MQLVWSSVDLKRCDLYPLTCFLLNNSKSPSNSAVEENVKRISGYLSMSYLHYWHFFDEFASSSTCFSVRPLPPPPLLKLGDGREADPGERRRAQSRARRDPEEEKKEGHHVVLLLIHGSDHCGVRPAHHGARREQPRHGAAGRGRKLDGGTGRLTD